MDESPFWLRFQPWTRKDEPPGHEVRKHHHMAKFETCAVTSLSSSPTSLEAGGCPRKRFNSSAASQGERQSPTVPVDRLGASARAVEPATGSCEQTVEKETARGAQWSPGLSSCLSLEASPPLMLWSSSSGFMTPEFISPT